MTLAQNQYPLRAHISSVTRCGRRLAYGERCYAKGFSVDSAMGIMARGELTFVAGAPRANHTGAVVLLKQDNVYRLVPQHIFWGEELASSFGYSVATTDLNKDG
uniref:Uncharacterized protein n=1 Tax=Neogobius melanostomus TaxID=47308 RepID=A0A8C6UAH1_9GOBI